MFPLYKLRHRAFDGVFYLHKKTVIVNQAAAWFTMTDSFYFYSQPASSDSALR